MQKSIYYHERKIFFAGLGTCRYVILLSYINFRDGTQYTPALFVMENTFKRGTIKNDNVMAQDPGHGQPMKMWF